MRFACGIGVGLVLPLIGLGMGGCSKSTRVEDSALACVSPTDSLAGETAHGFTSPVPVKTVPARIGTGTRVIYLDRYARAYVGGTDDAQAGMSSVVSAQKLDQIAIGGFQQGDDAWAQVLQCIRDEYAIYDVAVTDIRPVTPGYVEAHFGGTGTELALTDGAGGIAPIDSTHCDIVEGAPVFIFSDLFGDNIRSICEVGAHEIAHTFSLDHEFACKDPMTYVEGCGDKAFVESAEACGESGPRQCICGRPSQDSVVILRNNLGDATSDTVPPTVSLLPPIADPAGVGTRVQIQAHDPNGALDAIELHIVHMSSTGMLEESFDCVTGRLPCSLDGELASFVVPPDPSDVTIWAVAQDVAGNRTTSDQTTISASTTPAPAVSVVLAPLADAYAPRGIVEVQALVLAASPPAEVTAVWTDDAGEHELAMCPLGDVTTDGRWGVAVHIGTDTKPRTFHVRVTDSSGAGTESTEQTVPVVAAQTTQAT